MILDTLKTSELCTSYLANMSGRAILFGGGLITGLGSHEIGENNHIIKGILCGSDIDTSGLSYIRWIRNDNRLVVTEGVIGVETDTVTSLEDGVYVDSVGKIYSKPSTERVLIRNAVWVKGGLSPFLSLLQSGYVPNSDFQLDLDGSLGGLSR